MQNPHHRRFQYGFPEEIQMDAVFPFCHENNSDWRGIFVRNKLFSALKSKGSIRNIESYWKFVLANIEKQKKAYAKNHGTVPSIEDIVSFI